MVTNREKGVFMKKPVYIRCPRCELNYIEKKDKLCSVCKAELSAKKDEFIGDLDLELCPICKTNYIQPDEIMCATCLKERQAAGEETDLEQEWEAYVNRDDEEFILDDEETGDMASVSDLDDDILGADLSDDDLSFGGFEDEDDLEDDEEFNNIEDDFEELNEDDIDLDDDDEDDDDDKF